MSRQALAEEVTVLQRAGPPGLFVMGAASSSGKSVLARVLARCAAGRAPVTAYKAVSVVRDPVVRGTVEVDLSLDLLVRAAGASPGSPPPCTFVARQGSEGWVLRDVRRRVADLPVDLLNEDLVGLSRLDPHTVRGLHDLVGEDLRARPPPLLVEGASSPTDVPDGDLANLGAWEFVRLPIVLVASGRRGGAAAALVGTWRLLPAPAREAVVGFVLNETVAGTVSSASARRVTDETGVPCLGTVPPVSFYGRGSGSRPTTPAFATWDAEIERLVEEVGPWLDIDRLCGFGMPTATP